MDPLPRRLGVESRRTPWSASWSESRPNGVMRSCGPRHSLERSSWVIVAARGAARRAVRRAVRPAARMVRHPSASLPRQTGAWRETKAGYRLFAEEEVTFEALQKPHRAQTQAAAAERPLVLQIQDTSELDYTRHEAAPDLGPIGNGGGRGFLLHSTLAAGHTASAPEDHLLTWAWTLPAMGQQTVELRGRPSL